MKENARNGTARPSSTAQASAAPAIRTACNAKSSHIAGAVLAIAAVATIVIIWQIAATNVHNAAILPEPSRVVEDFCSEFFYDPGLVFLGIKTPSYGLNIAWTLALALVSWLIGGVSGMFVGLYASRSQALRNIAGPVFYVFGAIPALILAPFATIWFGHGACVEVAIVAFYCFITVGMISLSAGLSYSREVEEYAATLGLGRSSLFHRITLRGTMPENLVGMRIALAMSIAVQVTIELLGSQYGAGRIISIRASEGNVSAVLGMVLAMGLIALLFDWICKRISQKVTQWRG